MPESFRLGELVTLERGITYKSSLLGQPGPILLGLGSIQRHGGFKSTSLKTYGGDSPAKLLVQPGQLYASLKDVTQTADLLGAVARLPVDQAVGRLTQDTVRLDLKTDLVSPNYIHWMLRTPTYREYCRANSTGTTTMGLSRQAFFDYRIPAPDQARQNVVDLLDALDDKTAVNTGALRLLDELAQSEFTRARRGFTTRAVTFEDVAAIGGGGTPRTTVDNYWDGDILWATPTDVTALPAPYLGGTRRQLTDEGLAACSSALYEPGSILMTSRATIGAFAVVQRPMAVNQGFIVVKANDPAHQWWLFHEMRSRVDEFLTFANGATFLELPRGRFKALPVQVPDGHTAGAFQAKVSPLHERAVALVGENERLAATQDELLPLLMSGRITVRDADPQV